MKTTYLTKIYRQIYSTIANKRFLFLAVLTILVVGSFVYQSQTQSLASTTIRFQEEEIFNLTNQVRIKEGLEPFKWNNKLYEAAQAKIDDMEIGQYFDHISPTGTTPWSFIKENDYNYESAGENLAMDFASPQKVVKAWMESPTHKANILDLEFQEIGIAYQTINFENQPTVMIVQMFGDPRAKLGVLGESLANGVMQLAP